MNALNLINCSRTGFGSQDLSDIFISSVDAALQNILAYGDTDIFPFPLEQHIFFEQNEATRQLLKSIKHPDRQVVWHCHTRMPAAHLFNGRSTARNPDFHKDTVWVHEFKLFLEIDTVKGSYWRSAGGCGGKEHTDIGIVREVEESCRKAVVLRQSFNLAVISDDHLNQRIWTPFEKAGKVTKNVLSFCRR